MKCYIFFCLLSLTCITNSQTFEGINIFEFDKIPDGFEYYQDNYYIKHDIGYFQIVIHSPGDAFSFTCTNPSAMKFDRIYNTMYNLFGGETSNNDYIPNYVDKNDLDMIAALIDLGEAELIKIWDLPDNRRAVLTYKLSKMGTPNIHAGFIKKG